MYFMYGHHFASYPMGFGIFSLFPMLIFLGLVILLVAAFAGGHEEHDRPDEEIEDDTALEILRERYAKGEITKRQYLDMKKDLE